MQYNTEMLESIHAQETILAIMLYSEKSSEDVIKRVYSCTSDKMFTDKKAKVVYNTIKETFENNSEILGTKHYVYKLGLIIGIENKDMDNYVYDLESYWSPAQTIDYWLSQLQEAYFAMRYKEAESEKDFYEIIREKDRYQISNEMENIADESDKVIELYENAKKSSIITTYNSINQYIGSLQGGDMIILAGSTGGGKTCMMLNLVLGMAKLGKCIDIFSLEMPKAQLQERIICSEAEIDAHKFRTFKLSDEELKKFDDYANHDFKKLNIRIYKKQTVGIEEIKRIERKSKADIVFIDYLGLINSYDNKSSYEKFSNISRDIKLLAMECNKPIVALHQLNRNFQEREDKRPKTSDLRDSGKIEQDADMICFVYRPCLFDDKQPEDLMEFIIAKNRHGEPNKTVYLTFEGKYQKILERSA